MLVGPAGETRLSTLQPKRGSATNDASEFRRAIAPPTRLVTPLPAELVYDIAGKGYTRFRAIVGFDDQLPPERHRPSVRFFVFKDTPDPERLVRVAAGDAGDAAVRIRMDSADPAVFEIHAGQEAVARRSRRLAARDARTGDRAKGLADLFWAIAMQPEFQFIY